MKDKFSKLSREQIFESIERGRAFAPAMLPGRVKELRRALGLTQRQMAIRLGMSQPSYMRIEKNLGSSGMKTIARFLKELNCEISVRIKPNEPFSKLIRKRAYLKAKSMLGRTYANMALEKQSPDKRTYEKRLRELTEEMASNPGPALWED